MPSLAELTRRAVAVDGDFLALGHEVFEADGARFVRDRSLPRIYDANYVSDVRVATPDAVERLLARVDREYPHTRHRALQLDISTPPAVEAVLVLRGYEHSASTRRAGTAGAACAGTPDRLVPAGARRRPASRP